MSRSNLSRRDFVATIGAGVSLAAVPDLLARDGTRPLLWRGRRALVRVRGRVTTDGRPSPRVAVSDGLSVALTDGEGRYELLADPRMPGVWPVMPSGTRLPVSQHGTLRLHRDLDHQPEQRIDFALERDPRDWGRHAFVALADTQTLDRGDMARLHAETVPAVRGAVAELGDRPAFGVAVGDIMYDDLGLYPQYERAVREMAIPFAQVVGNHDLDFDAGIDEDSTRTFSRHFGPAWYAFNRGEVHYVVLDDVLWFGRGYIGHLGREQLEWLRQDLAAVEPGATVIVFIHIPLTTTSPERNGLPTDSQRLTNAGVLWRLLEPFNAHVVSGHTHEQEHHFAGDRAHEHNLATACGAWWTGPICFDGTPNGFGVYELDGSAVRWHYRGTGLARDHQMRVYPAGSDPSAPNEVVANVWNWDPAWTVSWYEGGDRRGVMARRPGRDPLSARLHGGPDRPARHAWVDPIVTDHLFYAPVGAAHGPIVVEAVDRFGQRYHASPVAATPG